MKRVLFVLWLLVLCTTVGWAECSPEQWKIDLDLVSVYLKAEPKNYVAAINLHQQWIEYATKHPEQVKQITGLTDPRAEITSSLNNVYRDAAQFLVNQYQDYMKKDPVKAAELGLNVQKYFRQNPQIAAEFAQANQLSVNGMRLTLNQAIKEGFMELYQSMAIQYSSLSKAGKNEEAAKLSAEWDKIVADLKANGNPLPAQFQKFTGVNIEATIDNLRDFEKDLANYKSALAAKEFDKALDLVKKWEEFAQKNPNKAQALHYVLNAVDGATPYDKVNWPEVFQNIRAEVYQAKFKADTQTYGSLIASGKLSEAKTLVESWQKIFDGTDGAKIAEKLGSNVQSAKDFINSTVKTLDSIDPAFSSENVASFKKDLEEYSKHEKFFLENPAGTEDWYNAVTRAAELADKWSRIAMQNPALAEEIKKATGISLPQDSDRVIRHYLDAALQESAVFFNNMLGQGKYAEGRTRVRGWLNYLDKHPRVKELAIEKWGKEFIDTLERYEKGLTIMIGDQATPPAKADTPSTNADAPATESAVASEPAAGTESSPMIQTTTETGLGASGQ